VIIEAWGEPKVFDLVASRKLALAVQQHGIAALVLRFGAEPEASAAETRWLVKAAPSSSETDDWETPLLEVALVRNRHGRTGQWLMEWDRHNGLFRAPHPGAGAAVPSHGPAETSVEGIRQAG
jgi:protein ImuA